MCEAVGFTPLWCLIGPVCILAAAPGPPTAYRGNPRGIIPNHCHNTNPPLTISRPARPASTRVLSRPTAPANIFDQTDIWWPTAAKRVFNDIGLFKKDDHNLHLNICDACTGCPKNIARGTTDPGYWLYNLNHFSHTNQFEGGVNAMLCRVFSYKIWSCIGCRITIGCYN